MKNRIILLILVCFAFTADKYRPIHVFMIGDSTMSNKSEKAFPETGWGQVLQDFFTDSIVISNHAKNGRSSKSFRDEGLWNEVLKDLTKGDYVIIEFGHNDSKSDEKRHTDPFTTYKQNLEQYIFEIKDKGAIPILCTPIVRRHFNEDGTLIDTHGDYLEAARKVAHDQNVHFIDMEKASAKVVMEMGSEKSKYLYLFIAPSVYPSRWKGVKDSTHLSQLGAYTIASLAVKELAKLKNLPLTRYLKK